MNHLNALWCNACCRIHINDIHDICNYEMSHVLFTNNNKKKRREKKQSQRLYLERYFCQCKIQFKGMFNISKNKNGLQKDLYICILRNTDVYFASKYYSNQIVIFSNVFMETIFYTC